MWRPALLLDQEVGSVHESENSRKHLCSLRLAEVLVRIFGFDKGSGPSYGFEVFETLYTQL